VGSSWRWAYAIVMVIQALLAVWFAVTGRRWDDAMRQPVTSTTATHPTGPSAMRRWWGQRSAMSGVVVVAVEAGLEAVIGLWTFVFLLEALLLPTSVAGVAVSGYWTALVVGRLLLGPVAERRGPWPVLAGSTTLACLAAVLLSLGGPSLAVASLVALGLALAPIYPLLVLTTAQRTRAASVDRLVGLQAAASTVGCVVFPGLLGLIIEDSPWAFAVAVLVLALATGCGLWSIRPGAPGPKGLYGRARNGVGPAA
jgi:fucose permease